MTHLAIPTSGRPSESELVLPRALRRAWLFGGVLLVIPFLFLQWLIWHLTTSEGVRSSADSTKWFIAAMGYLLLVLPGSFFWRGHLFRDYWRGRPVAPHKYILATITVGLALAAGGIFSMIGCLVTRSFMPNLIPALIALLLFALHWPTGRAMVKPVGHLEDPQIYEEPR